MQLRAGFGSVRRAAHVIAVSETTARDVAKLLGTPSGKITVTLLGVSREFSPEGPGLPADAFPGADRLSAGYVLYAGGLTPRKNLMRLLEAYREVAREMEAPPLVLPGGESAHAGELREKARELGLEGQVVFPGYVAEAALPALYRGATAFVYPSLYEGFGMAVLEAMASGTPVVTSDRGGTAEVAGEAALLVDPESVEALAEALRRLLRDEGLRKELSGKGLARSRGYRWELTAQETVRAYRQAAERD
jgi:glycosyltransferase involved in cell wall biosynthesis